MTENLPVPAGVPAAVPSDALLGAIALAAAKIAAEQAGKPAPPLTRDDVEAIARAAVVEAFKQFDVDLDRVESVQAHRAVLDHARRSLAFWGKAAGTVWTGLWTAIAGGVIAAVVKYGSVGGGR